MPFGLRNTRATYQRLVDKAFHKQIGRNLEVYVDDLVIKSRMKDEIVRDIEMTFKTLRETNIKLNPKKCTFRIEEGMFLEYKVRTRGLKKSNFHWIVEAEKSFKRMKQLIAELPMLVAPMEKEELIIYLAAAKETILANFIVKRPEEDSPDTLMTEEEELPEPWILFTDESSCTDTLTNSFKAFSIKQVPRSENKKANAFSKISSTSFAHLSKQVLVEELKEKSISTMEVLAVVEEEGDTWMTPIFMYLTDGTLSAEIKKARAVRCKSWRFTIINGTLCKKSFLGPWLRCVGPLQANYVLRKIHEGSCSMHAAGPFLEGPRKVQFLIVAIDYFTKWIEAKPVATITGNQIKKFMWDNIVCIFRLLGKIISDNEKQFWDDPFKDWCEKLCIRQHFASVKHLQTNGLVERENCSLGEGIKARLDERSKNWIEELPHVLCAHHTMIKSSNKDTQFSLTYGTEAVIPAKIDMPTLRTAEVDLVQNNEALEINLDLLEEKREEAAIREAKSKTKMEKNTITQKSKIQVSNQETLCTATMMQAERKIQGS
uniref:Reverse transcriptase domain-containing protein n=1 Tax=Tanacetum cinerariifolium TaxID=118510 RepID=A0A699GP82_TANCI|nr:reverse transcriptase domain-containing protein [Tanacetum cinerariifolium]